MKLLDLFFPPRCLSCRDFLRNSEGGLCPVCEGQWPHLTPPFCDLCSCPFRSSETTSHLCGECLGEPRSCGRVYAAGRYEGILHDLIVRLKYCGEERLARFLGRRMADALARNGHDLVLPVPLHARRLRERGFNQALLLARETSRVWGREGGGGEIDPLVLMKKRETPPQAVLKGEERRRNLKGVFAIRRPEKIMDRRILLVDDVYTTGATVEECSRALLRAGAKSVEALVLARAV